MAAVLNMDNDRQPVMPRPSTNGVRGILERMRSANWKSPKFWGGLALLAVAVTVMVVVLDIRSRLNQQDLSEINDIKTHVASINSSLNDVHTRINASTDQVDNVRERLDLMDSYYPINCHEYLVSRHNTTSGTYRIDPDGNNNGVSAFDVHCEFVYEGLDRQYSAYSRIDPKSNGPKNVFLDHDVKFEMSYAVGFDYSDAKMDQIAALISSSETCEQKIQFDCHLAKISQHAFWLDRNIQRQTYFTGSKSNESICECATSNTCGFSGSGLVCNCDQMYPVAWRKDSGTITNKTALPIRGLLYRVSEDDDHDAKNATVSIGSLICKGRSNQIQMQMPESCKDLKARGHTSGLHVVRHGNKDKNVSSESPTFKLVHCDMGVEEQHENFEKHLGNLDLTQKSQNKTRKISFSWTLTVRGQLKTPMYKWKKVIFDSVTVTASRDFDADKNNPTVANAFDTSESVFTAPWTGTYTIKSPPRTDAHYFDVMTDGGPSKAKIEFANLPYRLYHQEALVDLQLQKNQKIWFDHWMDLQCDPCELTLSSMEDG